jgi:hypothetical protein
MPIVKRRNTGRMAKMRFMSVQLVISDNLKDRTFSSITANNRPFILLHG